MLLFFSIITFTLASVGSDWASNVEAATNPDHLIEERILFFEVSKFLLTEKPICVEFFATFPTYNLTMGLDIEKKDSKTFLNVAKCFSVLSLKFVLLVRYKHIWVHFHLDNTSN